ncbi:MAG: hypothetical protein RL030_1683 [Pseudomonadota bacterium]
MKHPLAGRIALLLSIGLLSVAWAQGRPPPPKRPPAELLRLSIAAQNAGLSEPFKGVTADGRIEQGLFSIHSTGVSTESVRKTAATFLASLQPEQRARTTYAIDDDEWRKWMNQSFYVRQGVSFLEMSPAQREAALALMRAGLSAKGLQLSRDIMHLNQTLAELTDNTDEYGEYLYNVTVMGTPSATQPWGWQLDGHHLVINYFVLGDQVVMTPFFTGSEPIHATSGQYQGTSILQEEQAAGLEMINALDESQRGKAVLSFSKTGDNNLTEAWRDNVVLAWSGVRATELSAPQRARLLDLVALYVDNMGSGHARVKMDEVRANLDRTWFSWIGKPEPGSAFYYRIHSPVLLIEFDHQRPVARRHLEDPAVPTLEHIHTIVRTPNGNDYGKDLLRQHYALQPHR